ncbi:MAG: hypothetical protein JWN48_1260 [Myxococcaceae bacterium]|nr:hypothetical protein [Myxococcaceae bacterium]
MDFDHLSLACRAHSVRFLEAQLDAISARIRASRTRPLDRFVIGELTSLRFSATRLTRRLRILASAQAGHSQVRLLDPARELLSALSDASAEAARRGVLISLRLQELDRVSREINFIDSLASLVEDGIDAGANYLSLETRHTGSLAHDELELSLTTDAALDDAWLDVLVLGSLVGPNCSVHVDSVECGLTRVAVSVHASRYDRQRNHGAKRWSPSPSRV